MEVGRKIYPFIDKLVDTLFTKELDEIIKSENVQEDKNTFMMFISMYFAIVVYNGNASVTKNDLKIFMTDLVSDPERRRKCIEMFHKTSGLITNS